MFRWLPGTWAAKRRRVDCARISADRRDQVISVIIADDQTLVREGLAMLVDIEPDIEVVGQASDGAQAVELARRLRPDVVVMDIRMPILDGIEATRRLMTEPLPPRSWCSRLSTWTRTSSGP